MLQFSVGEAAVVVPKTDVSALTLVRGQSVKFKARVEKRGAYAKPLTLRLVGLPDGVEAADVVLPPDKTEMELEIKAKPEARPGAFPVTISAVVSVTDKVQLDRVTPPITLTIVEAPPAPAPAK